MNEYLLFLMKPTLIKKKNVTFLFFLSVVFFVAAINTITYRLVSDLIIIQNRDLSFYEILIFGVFIAPPLEELIFRSFLNLERKYSLSIVFLLMIVAIWFLFIKKYILATFTFILLILFSYLVVNKFNMLVAFLKKNYLYFCYTMAMIFTLLHLFNFTFKSLIVYPFFIFSYLFLSLSISYFRIKKGMILGVIFHAFYNLLIIIGDFIF